MKKKLIIGIIIFGLVIIGAVVIICYNSSGVFRTYDKSKTTIRIPDGVHKIASRTFADQDCEKSKVRTVIIPSSVTELGDEVFAFTCVDSVVFLDGFNGKIPYNTFMDSYLDAVYFPSTLENVEGSIFSNVEESPGDVQLNIHVSEGSYMDKFFKNKQNEPYYDYLILTDYEDAIKQYK